ncbi:MAG: hypothetical protein WC783_00075 [Candidatus Paceibacterota bacterium]|jgi:hypothetical protein
MYNHLNNVIRQKLIIYLKEAIQEHPLLNTTVVSNVFQPQGRPPTQIIVTASSGSDFRVSLDDYLGKYNAFSIVAKCAGFPSSSIEWVVDLPLYTGTRANRGIYYCRVNETATAFTLDPLYELDELVDVQFDGTNYYADLSSTPYQEKVYVRSDYGSFTKDVDYTLSGQRIVFDQYVEDEQIRVFYRFPGTLFGPFNLDKNYACRDALPGFAIAFGERLVPNDMQGILISDIKEEVGEIFGGRYNLGLSISLYALDEKLLEKLEDFVSSWLWENRRKLEDDNIIISKQSNSDQSNEKEIEIANIPTFKGGYSLDIITEWKFFSPYIFRVLDIESVFYPTVDLDRPTDSYSYSPYEDRPLVDLSEFESS